jgi:hypothetical protein
VIVVEEYEADKFIVALEDHKLVGLLDRTKNKIEAISIPSGEDTVMSLKTIKTDDGQIMVFIRTNKCIWVMDV